MAYFDPLCPILTGLLFLIGFCGGKPKPYGKSLEYFLDKFHEFSFGKIIFLIGFHLLNLCAFAVSFPNGGSRFYFKNLRMVLFG